MASRELRPWHTGVFISLLLIVFGVISAMNTTPEWVLNDMYSVRLPTWRPWEDFAQEQEVQAKAIKDSLREMAVNDSLIELGITPPPKARPGVGLIQFAPGDTLGFIKLAKALKSLKKGGSLRVLHYGDSQIEGDRITGEIRDALQRGYGGEGPGFQPIHPFVPMASVAHTSEGEWERMVSFGRANTKSPSNQYGLRGISHRYTTEGASINLTPRYYGYPLARRSKKFTLYHGPATGPLEVKWFANDTLWKIDYLESASPGGKIQVQASVPVKSLRLEFKGSSPDFYGISMEGLSGITVDNIAMRGADGLSFGRMNRSHFIQSLREHKVGLIILQFGGNSVPYFRSHDAVVRYGESFQRQIRLFKEALPDANILIIGPSDMATKEGIEWVSFPYVDDVRDILKKAAFKEGAGFFDVMTYMGGPGSMASWVKETPALAGPDHIHFTPKGAKKVAGAIVEGLLKEIDRHD